MKSFVILSLLTLAFTTSAFAENIEYYHCHNNRHHDCYQSYNASDRYDGNYDRQQRRHCDDSGHCRW